MSSEVHIFYHNKFDLERNSRTSGVGMHIVMVKTGKKLTLKKGME